MFDEKDTEELEEFVDGFIKIASITMDKIIEKGIPMQTAKVVKAYHDAYIKVGFSLSEAAQMVVATIRSQTFNVKS